MGRKRNQGGINNTASQRIKNYEQKKKSQKNLLITTVIIIGFILGLSSIYVITNNQNPIDTKTPVETAIESENEILIPLANLSESATFYTYNSQGVDIEYFAVKDTKGDVHVALNACDLCYSEKKGYSQINEIMQCLNCGQEFPITSIGTENLQGGCWPSFIPIQIQENNIVINPTDLEEKRFMCE